MTQVETAKILAVLTAAYPNTYKSMTPKEAEAAVLVWAGQFADIEYDIVFMALQKAISKNKFPPTVSDVRENITSLHWEAYEVIQDGRRMGCSEEQLAEYIRIYDHTEKYRYSNNAGLELLDMMPYTNKALAAGATDERGIK